MQIDPYGCTAAIESLRLQIRTYNTNQEKRDGSKFLWQLLQINRKYVDLTTTLADILIEYKLLVIMNRLDVCRLELSMRIVSSPDSQAFPGSVDRQS